MARLLGMFVLFVVLVVIVVGFVGASLPVAHTVSRTVVVPASPERVWALISHVQDYPRWRTGIKSVTKLPDLDGKFHWEEQSQMGAVPQVLTEETPVTRRIVTIADPNLAWGGSWTFDLAPQGNATSLTITENGTVRNVFFRFMGRYIFGQAATIEQYERDLIKATQG